MNQSSVRLKYFFLENRFTIFRICVAYLNLGHKMGMVQVYFVKTKLILKQNQ